jgi:hypothetical protein
MEEIVTLVVDLAMRVISVFAAGDKEKERLALLAVARRAMDEAAKRELA